MVPLSSCLLNIDWLGMQQQTRLLTKKRKNMKKIFFLCAAAALFAACSSDEVGEIEGVNEVVPSVEREYPSAASVEFTNGTAMIIGAFDENGQALTRANEGTVEFCINLGKLESDVLNNLGDYKLKADDFAIRIDGEYLESIKVEGNTASSKNIQLVEQDLKIAVKGLEKLDFDYADNYTFETWIWIENKKLLNDGTGSYGELLSDAQKAGWINESSWPVAEGEETGYDLSRSIWNAYGGNGSAFFTADSPAKGLLVKYNVYRGLQGQNGDTPYIKVSISVEKPEQTTVGDGANECTWVHIPYVAK